MVSLHTLEQEAKKQKVQNLDAGKRWVNPAGNGEKLLVQNMGIIIARKVEAPPKSAQCIQTANKVRAGSL